MKDDGRYYVEDRQTGQRGWLVKESDPDTFVVPPVLDNRAVKVRLDRPSAQVELRPWDVARWAPIMTAPPISEMVKAKIAHAAVREYANAIGEHAYSRKDMLSMSEVSRIELCKSGPGSQSKRYVENGMQGLWDVVIDFLTIKGDE